MVFFSSNPSSIVAIMVGLMHAAAVMWVVQKPISRVDPVATALEDSLIMVSLTNPPTPQIARLTPTPQQVVQTPIPLQVSKEPPRESSIVHAEPPPPQPAPTVPQPVVYPSISGAVEAPVVSSSPSQGVAASAAPPSPELAVSPPRQTSPSVDASFKGNRLPKYPAMSFKLGEQGTVTLRIQISAQGRAQAVELVTSSGHQRLDNAAIATVREWQFVPATRDGLPVTAWYEWRWTFKLQ